MKRLVLAGLIASGLTVACGSSDGDSDKKGGGGEGGTAGQGGAAGTGVGGSAAGTGGSGAGGSGGSGAATMGYACAQPPPPGAPTPPPPKSYSGGTCPSLVDGRNTMMSGGGMREFLLVRPSNASPGESLPVVFFWHWMGGDAQDFVDRGELVQATNDQRFIAVVPESVGAGVLGIPALDVKWPFDISQSQGRIDEELTFFDDMLACVAEQNDVNLSCVSSAGVSAGALFTAQLASMRGDYLASFVSLSGGVGGIIRPWGNPSHIMPAIVLSGGDGDNCFNVLNFQQQSGELKNALTGAGHLVIECVHNCGHAQPPVNPPPGQSTFAPFWDFVFEHPYWLGPGESPYLQSGLPSSFPEWCSIGVGTAVQRTGECIDPSEC